MSKLDKPKPYGSGDGDGSGDCYNNPHGTGD